MLGSGRAAAFASTDSRAARDSGSRLLSSMLARVSPRADDLVCCQRLNVYLRLLSLIIYYGEFGSH
jgi:hypothetical protein